MRVRGLATLLDEATGAVQPRLWSQPTGSAAEIAIPPLDLGAQMLAHVPTVQPIPEVASYRSVVPWTCHLLAAAVHGPRGVLRLDDVVIANTLPGADAGDTHQGPAPDGVCLRGGGMVRRLPGRTLSLLGVGPENYWHWMMDGLGRLAADPGAVEACRHVLVPSLTRDFQTAGLAAAGIDHTALVEMEIGDTVEAEHLVVPWTNIGDFAAHPCLGAWFAGPFVARLGVGPVRERVRLYLDRSAGRNRRLVNEAAVIDALAPLGFTAVRPEAMTLAAQASLFARAECVVAPHGAGLTNLLFAPPGCAVLELHMDAYVHWCFHRLAALLGQRYECVIGRALGPHDANPHARSWSVSPMHVRAAVETMLAADTTAPG